MTEKQYQGEFGRWVKDNMELAKTRFGECAAIELKVCRGPSLSVDAVKDHQVAALDAAASGGLYYRIVDQPFIEGRGFQQKKPFDCLIMSGVSAWIAILVYVRGQRHAERRTLVLTTGGWKSAVAMALSENRKSIRLGVLEACATKIITGI